MISDDILALLVGADVGLQERRNAQMRAQGIRPTFWQRHPMLPYVLGFLFGPFVVVWAVIPGAIGWLLATVWIDQHLGNTGLTYFVTLPLPLFVISAVVQGVRQRPKKVHVVTTLPARRRHP